MPGARNWSDPQPNQAEEIGPDPNHDSGAQIGSDPNHDFPDSHVLRSRIPDVLRAQQTILVLLYLAQAWLAGDNAGGAHLTHSG